MSEDFNQDRLNMSLRKFLKQVGVTSQRELEKLIDEKGLRGSGKLAVRTVLTAEGTDLEHVVEGEIDLG
jgi:16S rRNA U516 pseudouridylate synthase RsuA-like enzyme